MTKKYDGVKYIKRKRPFATIFRRLFYVVFVLVVAVSFGRVFAGVSTGDISLHILGQRDKVKVGKTTYYALDMGHYDNIEDAKTTANIVSQAGGAGFVWCESETSYVVIGSVYQNESDCEKVIQNLSESYKASAYKITLKKCKFVIEDISKKEQLSIRDTIEFCSDVYESLQTISLDYDTGNISNIAVGAKANSLKSKVMNYKNQIDLLNIKYNSDNLQKIYDTLQYIENTLDLLTNQMLTTENNLNLVKYAFVDILRASFDLRNDLK